MGMAASQVRFLSLQNRKNTVGLNLMTLSNRKLALSRDMNRIANEYNDAMNLKTLKWSSDSGVTYNDLSYDMLMKPNDLNATLPYIVTDANGRVVVDDSNISFDGFTSDYSYRDLATLISTYSGTDSKTNLPIYDNVDNVNGPVDSAISGNASLPGCEYTNVSDVNQYDIKSNSLRYDLLSKLGVISEEDYESFLAASANVSGNAIGESFTNWEDVLDKYIKDGGMTNTGSPVTLELSDKDGNVEEVSSSTYFGTWDPTKNTFVGGCAKGNLAVAKYELDQYQSWCGELHKANLNSETTHTFTGISGITLTQSTDSILSSLDEATDSPDNPCTTKTIVDNYEELGGDFSNWTGIYNSSTACVEVTGFTGNNLVDLLTVMGGSLFNAFTSASNTEGANGDRGWSLSNQISDDDYNIDADNLDVNNSASNVVKKDLAKAASEWALKQTMNFYNVTYDSQHYAGKSKNPLDHAVNNSADFNGVTSSKKKKTIWSIIATVVGVIAGVIAGVVTGGSAWVAIAAGLVGGALGTGGGAVVEGDKSIYTGSNRKYAFNVNNFMETYFTFYQMYIDAEGDTSKLIVGNSTQTVNDDSVGVDVSNIEKQTDLLTSSNQVSTYTDSSTGTTYYVKEWNSSHTAPKDFTIGSGVYAVQANSSSKGYLYNGQFVEQEFVTFTDEDGGAHSVATRNIYVDKEGNTVDVQVDKNTGDTTATYTNPSGLMIDGNPSQYKKIIMRLTADGEETYEYYDSVTSTTKLAQPTKEIPSAECEYNGLKVANSGSVFTGQISVYLTPNSANLQILNDRITQAEKALADANAGVESVYSEKEKRLMAYFDAIFKMISSNGWVYDESVNSDDKTASKNYLNAKLQNNMYFITEVETVDGSEYNYATKLASNVSKIFEVYDKDAQNAALSKYEAEKAEINSKEKQIDIRMNKLEAEQDAISTELDSIKKIIDDNVSTTFKIFT